MKLLLRFKITVLVVYDSGCDSGNSTYDEGMYTYSISV